MVASQKLPQILHLEPASEILFKGPFDVVVTSWLELWNPSEKRVCFKVKTTAPRRYCVRPNSGIIEPKGKCKIAIMLQPMDADIQAERNKHKFMVQSTIIHDDDDTIPLEEIWTNAPSEEIMDSKLRCVFQTPEQERDSQATSGGQQKPQDDTQSKQAPNRSSLVLISATGTTPEQAQRPRQVYELPITTTISVLSRATSSSSDSQRLADKSVASSQNITSSFLELVRDDNRHLIAAVLALIIGIILGKYIL